MPRTEKGNIKNTRTQAEKLAQEVDYINDMKYTKSRKDRAELIRKQLKNVEIICGAVDRSNGKICSNSPAEGSTNGRCYKHGGLNEGPKTEEGKKKALANLDPRASMIHGLYSNFTMSVGERDFYTGMMNYYIEEFELDPANIMMLDRAIRNFMLNQRKEVAEEGELVDETDSYNDYDTKFLRYMQALGMDRKFNVSKDHKDNQKSNDITMLFMDEENQEGNK